jgi:23S rRNA (guanine745-N1)-methyltransferase
MSSIQIRDNIHMFKCPICGGRMRTVGLKSIVCSKSHCFDLSKRGYVNMLQSPVKTEYNKPMLQSRNQIIKSGLYKPLTEKLCQVIIDETGSGGKGQGICRPNIKILDAGCGEGSHLAQVVSGLKAASDIEITAVGIDISKDGIQIASRDYPDLIWCVADLTNVPFADHHFDVVLNILSPSNYAEFGRLLPTGGILIKVVPGSDYLIELRQFLYDNTDKQEYSNERVIEHFEDSFDIVATHRVFYKTPIDRNNLEHLIRMTPLSWGAKEHRLREALDAGIDSITVDMTVLWGQA